jgi:hypothetical protein
MYWK